MGKESISGFRRPPQLLMDGGFGKLSAKVGVVLRDISFEIGYGSTVRFLKDKWCGELELWR